MTKKCRKCGSTSHHLIRDCGSLVSVEETFLDVVERDKEDLNDKGCWGIRDTNSNMTIHHPQHGTVYLVRLSYAVGRGMKYEQILMDIPTDGESCPMAVTNWCGTHGCLNPLHLVHITRQKLVSRNIESGARKGVTDEDKREIRRKYRSGGYSQAQLANEYGISQTSVSYICNRWRDCIEDTR